MTKSGIRRCGKSYLLKNIYRDYLIQNGVKEEQIITIELDLAKDIKYRNPLILSSYVREKVEKSKEEYYLFIDEIQMSDEVANPYNPGGKKITFYDALNDLRGLSNLDVYVTGSNSKMLSSDILTEFRGRSDEIRVHPLCFAEYYSAVGGDKNEAFDEYAFYGGMPLIMSRPNDTAKMNYLKSLFSESKRYNVKGKSYFDSPNKYYSEDIGLRNARIGFCQQEMTHIMENIIYDELNIRQFSIDVGVVYARTVNNSGSSVRTPREIDFVVNSGGKRTYIQSSYAMPTDEKAEVELRPFALTGDFFPKIVVRKDIGKRWYDDNGILNINVIDFLLDKELI